MRPHGHARVNARWPQAGAICDRCGRLFNHVDLQFQFDWRGVRLQNLRILVCSACLDTPQQQLRARILSPDPMPIMNARPEPFAPSGVGPEQTQQMYSASLDAIMVTEAGVIMIPEGTNFIIFP